jgi:hypothetical protein
MATSYRGKVVPRLRGGMRCQVEILRLLTAKHRRSRTPSPNQSLTRSARDTIVWSMGIVSPANRVHNRSNRRTSESLMGLDLQHFLGRRVRQ